MDFVYFHNYGVKGVDWIELAHDRL